MTDAKNEKDQKEIADAIFEYMCALRNKDILQSMRDSKFIEFDPNDKVRYQLCMLERRMRDMADKDDTPTFFDWVRKELTEMMELEQASRGNALYEMVCLCEDLRLQSCLCALREDQINSFKLLVDKHYPSEAPSYGVKEADDILEKYDPFTMMRHRLHDVIDIGKSSKMSNMIVLKAKVQFGRAFTIDTFKIDFCDNIRKIEEAMCGTPKLLELFRGWEKDGAPMQANKSSIDEATPSTPNRKKVKRSLDSATQSAADASAVKAAKIREITASAKKTTQEILKKGRETRSSKKKKRESQMKKARAAKARRRNSSPKRTTSAKKSNSAAKRAKPSARKSNSAEALIEEAGLPGESQDNDDDDDDNVIEATTAVVTKTISTYKIKSEKRRIDLFKQLRKGQRIEVWFQAEKEWFRGTIEEDPEFDPAKSLSKASISFDDGDNLDFKDLHEWDWKTVDDGAFKRLRDARNKMSSADDPLTQAVAESEEAGPSTRRLRRKRDSEGKQLEWNSQESSSTKEMEEEKENSSEDDDASSKAKTPKRRKLPDAKIGKVKKLSTRKSSASKKRKRGGDRGKSTPTTVRNSRTHTGRVRWTKEEEEYLIAGVKRYGKSWVEILKNYEFQNRTNVNLKDKWRNLKKRDPDLEQFEEN